VAISSCNLSIHVSSKNYSLDDSRQLQKISWGEALAPLDPATPDPCKTVTVFSQPVFTTNPKTRRYWYIQRWLIFSPFPFWLTVCMISYLCVTTLSCEFYTVKTITLYNSDSITIQNNPAVKKVCGPEVGHCERRCEIQGGSQEMAGRQFLWC